MSSHKCRTRPSLVRIVESSSIAARVRRRSHDPARQHARTVAIRSRVPARRASRLRPPRVLAEVTPRTIRSPLARTVSSHLSSTRFLAALCRGHHRHHYRCVILVVGDLLLGLIFGSDSGIFATLGSATLPWTQHRVLRRPGSGSKQATLGKRALGYHRHRPAGQSRVQLAGHWPLR